MMNHIYMIYCGYQYLLKGNIMEKELIFVTGYFGAPIKKTAEDIANRKNYDLISLDDEIKKSDGRSVIRICMIMGEHEYRNKEYELLLKLTTDIPKCDSDKKGIVIYCGDGVLHDEMSKNIIEKYSVIIAGSHMTAEELWSKAKNIKDSTHAFMYFGDEETKRRSFDDLYYRQHTLYTSLNLRL